MGEQSHNLAAGGPDHRDLYLVIVGIIVGVLIGPGVLGRVSPATYDRMFVGSAEVQQQREAMNAELQKSLQAKLARLEATGVTEVAAEELERQMQDEYASQDIVLQAKMKEALRAKQDDLQHMIAALILAIVVLMVIETVIPPASGRIRQRLSTVRYAMIAIWIAIVFARPDLIRGVDWTFVVLLLVVGLIVGLIPMGKRRAVELP